MRYRDLNDIDIKVGDFIAYAALWSRSPILKYGLVTRLEKREGAYVRGERKEVPTLRVISVDRSSRYDKEKEEYYYIWELQNHGKEITLGMLDRLLVIPKAMVPREVFDTLMMEGIRCEKNPT